MALDDNSPIVEAFCQLGNKPFTLDDIGENPTLEHLETVIPEELRPLEHFLCSVYSPKGPFNIPDLRWELFRTKLKEGENLPPSKGAYIPHLMRANYVSMRDKSYTDYCPQLPPIHISGWEDKGDHYTPVQSLLLPAPKSVIQLIQCGCKVGCIPSYCACAKERLPCTLICKCYNTMCQNPHTRHDLRLGGDANESNDYDDEDEDNSDDDE